MREHDVSSSNPHRYIHLPGAELTAEQADHHYVVRYARLGAVVVGIAAINALVYFVSTPDGPRRPLLVALCCVALLVAVVAAVGTARLVGGPWETKWFAGFSASVMALIGIGAAADGGSTSPLSVLLILPVVYASIAYPITMVQWIAVITQTIMLGLMLIGHAWGGDHWHLFVLLAIFNILAVTSARNRTSYQETTRELAMLAAHDDLTGCLNYGAFNSRLQAEVARAGRYGRPFCLLIADIDHFKEVNDAFGHPAGDRVLRTLSEALSRNTREADAVGRLGGDEFGILLVDTKGHEGMEQAERLRSVLQGIDSPRPVTMSIGMTAWTGPDDNAGDLVRRADKALYQAKASGRGRTLADSEILTT